MDFPIRRSSDLFSFDVTYVLGVLYRGYALSFTPAFACLKISLNSLIFQVNRIFTFLSLFTFFSRACNSNNVLGCHATGLVFHSIWLLFHPTQLLHRLTQSTRVSSNLAQAKLRYSLVAASIWNSTSLRWNCGENSNLRTDSVFNEFSFGSMRIAILRRIQVWSLSKRLPSKAWREYRFWSQLRRQIVFLRNIHEKQKMPHNYCVPFCNTKYLVKE